MDLFSLVLSFVAIGASVWAVQSNLRSSDEASAERLISNSYSTFYALDKLALEHPNLGHLFSGPDQYPTSVAKVRTAFPTPTAQSRALLALQESAGAGYIYDYFEEMVLQLKHDEDSGDVAQTAYVKRTLRYFTDDLLRNPRLAWFWDAKGGGIVTDYDVLTQNYYKEHVLSDAAHPLKLDSIGPFGVPSQPPRLKS